MDLSFSELLLIGLVAFMVLGPEDFIRFASRAGKFMGKARDQMNNFRIMAEEEVMNVDKNSADQKKKIEVKEDSKIDEN